MRVTSPLLLFCFFFCFLFRVLCVCVCEKYERLIIINKTALKRFCFVFALEIVFAIQKRRRRRTLTRRFLTSKEMEENAQKRWRNRRTPDKKGRRRGISERSFVEKNVAASEHRALRKAAAEDGEEGERNGKEEEKERKKDAIQAWEETASKPGWNVEPSPLSEEQVHELERYFQAPKRSRMVSKYALFLVEEEEGDFKSKNKAGVSFLGVGPVVDAKRKIFSTSLSSSVFVKLFDERLYEKIKVSDEQCLKKETKALAKFLSQPVTTVAILPMGKRITREAYKNMQKEGICVVRGYLQKNVKHVSEHHHGPSARRSEQTHPV